MMFEPTRPLQPTCNSFDCQVEYANRTAEKAAKKRQTEIRRADKAKREKLKTRSDYLKEAQAAFNAWVRARDKEKLCICCGQPLAVEALTGGGFDCGHYRSVGSAPHLRFDERNAHGQRKVCNRWGAGRAVDYRIGLVKRIGLEAVEALEADQATKKWTAGELQSIRDHYRAALRELKKANHGT